MKLDKSEALMIYTVLFHYVNTSTLNHVDGEAMEDVVDRLHDFLTSDETESSPCDHHHEESTEEDYEEDEDDFEEEEEEEEEEQLEPIDSYVSMKDASDLQPLKVITPDGSTMSLEFEDVDDTDSVDVLINDGEIIIEKVSRVIFDNAGLSLHDGEEWHDFRFNKPPKAWKRLFAKGKVFGFKGDEA